ncbi:energy-coupling factor ABC transporter substrate-binding protein [Phormidium sp. CLA17]|uniref:energy-coupling factor ABC transporter substrate-binding protein n=1 Tax=Leptolyngbya sp. Cla-17 TaxID=2803751 RepID=UPI001493069E|nr:energy-coupling factor ABC transporter substrate-binding protein [Leptolyngbya sp. Cla-17]MBM0744011.1 energy-coupling factor ABC transporter substrate-binding protein [Leptolyngbya sp. Cla-17]
MKKLSSSWLLMVGVVVLALGPLLILQGKEFSATDGNFTAAIEQDHPNYKPWFEPIIKDSGPEVQTFLFAAQAGIGAGVTGYILGLYKGRSEKREKDES